MNDSRVLNNTSESRDSSALAAKDFKFKKDPKRWGEFGELAFMMKSTSVGITASHPFGDRKPYDFLVEGGRRLFRVQVKSVFSLRKRFEGYPVLVSQRRGKRRVPYTSDDIDFIAAYIASLEVWYLIPVESLGKRKFIRLYPNGTKTQGAGLFEHYREAWHLLKS